MLRRRLDKRTGLGLAYALVGVVGLIYLLNAHSFAPTSHYFLFVALYVWMEWRTAEIDDRLYGSAAVMVLMVVGVAFGENTAVLPMVLAVAAGVLTREDVARRRVFQPAVNMGQLTVSAAAAGVVLDFTVGSLDVGRSNVGLLAFGAALAGVVYSLINIAQVALIVRIAYGRADVQPWTDLGKLIPAHVILSAVGGMLGATYLIVGPVVTPFIVIMVLMAHFAATSYAGVRESHASTMRGFIKALEARDLFTRGHTERSTDFALMISDELGLSDERKERLRWAVLLSEVSSLAVPRDLIEHQDDLTPEEQAQLAASAGTVDDMLAQVEFLRPAMDIVRRRDFSGPPSVDDPLSLDAHILGVAKRFDQLTCNRPRAAAMSQADAFDELRLGHQHRFAWEVVDALQRAIEKSGLTYGAIERAHKLTLEDLRKQRMYERR